MCMRTALLLLSFFTAMLCHAQKTPAEYELKGKVRSVRMDMELYDKKADSIWHHITYREFNEQGNETAFVIYDSYTPDSVHSREVYTYNGQGKLTERVTERRGKRLVEFYFYNAQRQLVKKSLEEKSGCIGKVLYTYNAQGKTDSIIHLSANGVINKTETYLYNGKYPVQVNVYDSLGRLNQILYYADTAAKKMAEQYWRVKNADSLRLYFKAVYHTSGEWLVHQYFFANGSSSTYQKQVNNANETMAITTTNIHRSKKTVTTDRYEYTYDDKGNWVTCILKSKGRPDRTTTRTITYY